MSDLIETGTNAIFQLGLRLTREEARAAFLAGIAAIELTHRVVPADLTSEMYEACMLSARPPLPDGGKT